MDNRARGAGHEQLREWVALEREPGELLSPHERRQLDEHLDGCLSCREEREAFSRLGALLSDSAVPVRGGFRDDVMRSLPAAGWETRAPRAWRLPIAVLLLLGIAAGWTVALPSTGGGAAGAFTGALTALADMTLTGALAASGLLWASWRGLGLAIDTYLAPGAAIALFVLVVSLDVLLLSILVRSGKAAPEGAGRGRPEGRLSWRRGKRF